MRSQWAYISRCVIQVVGEGSGLTLELEERSKGRENKEINEEVPTWILKESSIGLLSCRDRWGTLRGGTPLKEEK